MSTALKKNGRGTEFSPATFRHATAMAEAVSLKHEKKFTHMNWYILIIASLFEIGFAASLGMLKTAKGPAATWWLVTFAVCLVLSVYLLYKATQTLPVGTAYAVWTGLGAAGIVLLGIFFFKEPATFWRIFFLTTLIASIVGLKLVS